MAKLIALFHAFVASIKLLFRREKELDTSIDYEDGEPHEDHAAE